MGAPGLSVVLPTLDEAEGLTSLLPRLKSLFGRLGVEAELIVVDGGSKDATQEVAISGGAVVQRQKGRGFGAAVREGIASASAPWIVLLDADGSHAPEAIDAMWARRDDFELIVGSRYTLGGSAQMPASRWLLSGALNVVSRRVLALPVHDSSSGFRLYRASAAKSAAAASNASDFSIQQDLMVRILAGGGRVGEEAIHYAPRVGGRSKADAWKLLPAYVRLLLRLKGLRGGWAVESGLVLVLFLGLAMGLCGLRAGLPDAERLRALGPEVASSQEFARKLADAWTANYAAILKTHVELAPDEPSPHRTETIRIPAGWSFPPSSLLNSARSLYTQSDNPDEKKTFIILSHMKPKRLDFKPLYVQYGGAFVYPFGVWLAAGHLLRLTRLAPDLAAYLTPDVAMAGLYRSGRIFTLFFHLATIFVLYEMGLTLAGRRAAVAAAAIFALTPFVIVQSHVLKPHPIAAFWFALSALFAMGAVEEGRLIDHILCGVAAGLAVGSNLSLVVATGLPLLARAFSTKGRWSSAFVGAAFAGAVAAATNPYLLLSPRDYAWELTVYARSHIGVAPMMFLRLLTSGLPRAVGAGAGTLIVFGIFSGIFQNERRRRMLSLLCMAVGTFLWFRFSSFGEAESVVRLFYAPFAVACVLSGAALAAWPRVVMTAVLAVVLAESGARASAYLANYAAGEGAASTRVSAARWIDAHIPAKSDLGLLRPPEPSHTPAFRWDRVNLVVFESTAALNGAKPPEWLVASDGDVDPLAAWVSPRYEEAASFQPLCRYGFCPTDDSFFVNAGFRILHLRPAEKR